MRRFASSASLLLALLLLASPALAGEDFGAHYRRAEQLYEEGRFADSIDELRAAFAIKPLPRLLLNIGQLHLKLGQPEQALAAYDSFQRLSPRRPLEVEETLRQGRAEAQALLERRATERAAEQARLAEVARGGQASPASRPSLSRRVEEPPQNRPPQRSPEARPLARRWWLWTAVGLAAAGVATGIAIGVTRPGSTPSAGDVEVLDISFRGAALRQTSPAALVLAW